MVKLLRHITNGQLLENFNNQPVSITGIVTNVNPNGKFFEVRAVDDKTVVINLNTPLDDTLDGYVEVRGVCRGKTVAAEEFIQFTSQQSDDFDVQGHNQLCHLLHSLNDVFKWRQD